MYDVGTVGPLFDWVRWYKITHAGTQVTQWDFQNKGRSRWTGTSCFVLEVPLCNLLTSMCDFVPCDGSCKGPIYAQTCGLYALGLFNRGKALSRNRTQQATACPARNFILSESAPPLLIMAGFVSLSLWLFVLILR